MKINLIRVLAVAATLASLSAAELASSGGRLAAVNRDDAQRAASSYVQPVTGVSMYIWSDKYVYQPGEALTLRWTLKTNNDLYPYTVVAYRQNNQTGAKFYLPANNSAPTDIFGNTAAQGFQPTRLADASKQILVGAGGVVLPNAYTIPNELGMHTIAVELRDYTGNRVLKTAYMKIGVVDEFVTVNGTVINANATWVNTKAYRISGIVRVEGGATLNIQPGTFVIGQPGSQPPSVLVITTSGRINARGTRSRPIIMTSSLPFGQRQRGDWGGLIMLGRARINITAGVNFIEGLSNQPFLQYGGTDDTHNCGALQYVRVEYAGSILAPNSEVNSITWGGCGSQTISEHLQTIYGLDDSFEWFGGTSDAKWLVGGLGADDYLDYQLGYRGRVQYLVGYQDNGAGRGNRGIEGDNSEFGAADLPYSNPQVYNATFIGSGAPGFDENTGDAAPAIYLRRGSRGSFNNIIGTNFGALGFFVNGAATFDQISSGDLTANGILLWNNGRTTNAANTVNAQLGANPAASLPTLQAFAAGTVGKGFNFIAADPQLIRPFEFSDPDFRPVAGSIAYRAGFVQPPDDGFFDQNANFLGGIGEDNWMEEWTNFLRDEDIKP